MPTKSHQNQCRPRVNFARVLFKAPSGGGGGINPMSTVFGAHGMTVPGAVPTLRKPQMGFHGGHSSSHSQHLRPTAPHPRHSPQETPIRRKVRRVCQCLCGCCLGFENHIWWLRRFLLRSASGSFPASRTLGSTGARLQAEAEALHFEASAEQAEQRAALATQTQPGTQPLVSRAPPKKTQKPSRCVVVSLAFEWCSSGFVVVSRLLSGFQVGPVSPGTLKGERSVEIRGAR